MSLLSPDFTTHPIAKLRHLAGQLVLGLLLAWPCVLRGADEQPAAADPTRDDQYFFTMFGTELGLPQANVALAILQTRDGYLWVGTEGGLARFDGVRFVSFRSSNTPAFRNNLVHCLHEDRAGSLWVGTERGLLRYRNGVFESIAGLEDVPVNAVAEDSAGRIWIGTYGRGLFSYQEERLQPHENDPAMPSPLVLSVFVDSTDRLWIGFARANGVVLGENGRFRRFASGGLAIAGNVQAISEAPRGTMWFGTRAGPLFRLRDGKAERFSTRDGSPERSILGLQPAIGGGLWIVAGTVKKLIDPEVSVATTVPSAWAGTVSAVYEDREGSLWQYSRDVGLIRAQKMPYRAISSAEGLRADNIKTVTEDTSGNLWLGAQRLGIIRVAPDGDITTFTAKDGLPGSDPRSVVATRDGRVWGAFGKGLSYWHKGKWTRVPGVREVYTIYEDRAGDIWLGTGPGVMRIVAGKVESVNFGSDLHVPHVSAFCEGADGAMYIGTWNDGVFRLKDGQMTVFNRKNGLPGDDVRAVFEDSEKRLWVGFRSSGLALREHDRWFASRALSEAVLDHVTAVTEDDNGQLWLGTPAGVMWAPKSELAAAARGENPVPKMRIAEIGDGVRAAAVWSGPQPIVWTTRNKKLIFATRSGVLAIDPQRLPENPVPPPVLIERVFIDGQPDEAAAATVKVRAGTRELMIEYTALSFVQPKRVLFKYKLEGYEEEWVEAGTRRTAFYTNLPPGNYVFRVQACNSAGLWNETGAHIGIVQQPRFYQTWWFVGLGVAGSVGFVFGVNRWSHRQLTFKLERLEQKQAMEKERHRIARNLHDDLGASLTELGLYAEMTQRKAATLPIAGDLAFLSTRVRNLAGALDAVVWTVNPANDSLDRLAPYICEIFQELFRPSTIRCRLEVTGDFPPFALSPEARSNLFLCTKEAFNNIIKHSGATEVWLRMKMDGDHFCLAIEDDGRGFDPALGANNGRNGLANMRSRIEDLRGVFTLNSAPGKGTSISIVIAFEERKNPSPHPSLHS